MPLLRSVKIYFKNQDEVLLLRNVLCRAEDEKAQKKRTTMKNEKSFKLHRNMFYIIVQPPQVLSVT